MSESIKSIHFLKSGQLDEIIGQPPNWLVRWGSIIFLMIIILIVSLSILIRYPEMIVMPFKTIKSVDNISVILQIRLSDAGRVVESANT